jgi:tRNA A-37 threonylcarbamoyl transferase component Bud32
MVGFESLLTGRTLGERYRVESVVGRGGMGAVFHATDTRLERAVALKVVTATASDAASRERLRARFHREARSAARLHHRNVVAVYDYGTDARLDLDFLVMELLRGEDLARRLARESRLPPDEALALAHDAARGLAAGHRAGLIHRDVKPGNLFLEDDGTEGTRLVVLDFGIVKHDADEGDDATMTHLTVLGNAPHSPAYAAPEQLQGDPALTPACDVFALGVTLFQMLTGMRPFGEADQDRMAAGQPVRVPLLRSVNPALPLPVEELVRTALAVRPGDRFADAGAMAEALGALRGVPRTRTTLPGERRAAPPAAAAARDDDATWLDTGFTGTRDGRTLAAAQTAAAPERARPSLDDVLAVATPAPRALAEAAAPRPVGWARRAATTAWHLTVTLFAMALAVGFGIGMVEAFDQDLHEPFYACVAGLTLALPWSVHRLHGRRGSYLAGSVTAAAVAVIGFRYFTPLVGHYNMVLLLAPAQLLAATWAIRLTRVRLRAQAVPE